jgi:hypothetical protein
MGPLGFPIRKFSIFILMVLDDNSEAIIGSSSPAGIPVAFLFFSAPSGNHKTDAGYDISILAKLLNQ